MTKRYADLIEISELLHMKALDLFRQRRDALRRTDAKLDEIQMMREVAQADTDSVDARRMSGSDAMWQGWLAVRTSQLQQEKAINRALEIEGLAQSRTSFARLDAAENLARADAQQAKIRAAKRHADTLDWLNAMQGWRDPSVPSASRDGLDPE